jgi:hypothetical protein
VGDYLSDSRPECDLDLRDWQDRKGTGEARLVRFAITDEDGAPTSTYPLGGTACFDFEAEVYQPLLDPCFGIVIHNSSGEALLDLRSAHHGLRLGRVEGRVRVHGVFPNIGLYPGKYFLTPWISDSTVKKEIDLARMCCSLHITPRPNEFGDLRLDPLWGKFWVNSEWTSVDIPNH